jgi:ubiquinone/menaquinone biosynthesis C-methylase UbiE
MANYYPESKVEVHGFTAKHYDALCNILTFGSYSLFIKKAIRLMEIGSDDRILDLGAGTGRNACLMLTYLSGNGEIVGVDISDEMILQFKKKCTEFPNAKIFSQRIDQPLPYKEEFDKVLLSFVLHGFPQDVREQIVDSAFEALGKGGELFILDYNEFFMKDIPFYARSIFKLIECPYAFDFVEKDWKRILNDHGFDDFKTYHFFRGYIRLLMGRKK